MDLCVDFVVLLLFVRDKMWERERERSMEREEYKQEIQLVFIHLFFRFSDGRWYFDRLNQGYKEKCVQNLK